MGNERVATKRKRKEIIEFVCQYLLKHPCEKCGEARLPCLQFDHVRDKIKPIPEMIYLFASKEIIMLEIAKCQVLGANCHKLPNNLIK